MAESKKQDTEDLIDAGDAFVIGNPNAAWMQEKISKLYEQQIAYEERRASAIKQAIDWGEASLPQVELQRQAAQHEASITKLNEHLTFVAEVKGITDEVNETVSDWNEGSAKLSHQIDSIIAGIQSSLKGESSPIPTISVTYPEPSYTPTRITCLSENMFIGVRTTCF